MSLYNLYQTLVNIWNMSLYNLYQTQLKIWNMSLYNLYQHIKRTSVCRDNKR